MGASERSLRGKVAVAGVGETTYYRHGQSPDPEFVLCLKAILAACADAGIDPRDIDGFASYSNDRNETAGPGDRLGNPRTAVLQHAVERRRRRRGGGHGQRRRGHRRRPGRLRGRLPRPGPGRVRPLRPGPPDGHDQRRPRPHRPLRPDVAGPVVRSQGHALHARAQHWPGRATGESPWPPTTTPRRTRGR